MKLAAWQVRQRLHYDTETGVFTRAKAVKGFPFGSVCGSLTKNGYVGITVAGYKTYAHRLAFLYMTGKWPPGDVDHINGDRADNRWCNLRLATRAQNMWNVPGATGAYCQRGRWYASIKVDGVKKSLGGYATKEEAAAAYARAAAELRGEFARAA